MARSLQLPSLIWGLFLTLGGAGLVMRLWIPNHWMLPWARHAHMKGMQGVQKLVAPGAPVLELSLREPVRVRGFLGLSQPTTRLAVSVEDPAAFRAALEQA